ncbi:hypothetical protein D9M73_171520 [compost metagenome]
MIQRQVIGATHGRLQVLDGFLQVRVVGERVSRAHHRKAFFDENLDVLALQGTGQALLDVQECQQVAFIAPVLCNRIAQKDVQLAHQGTQAAHAMFVEFGHMGATARQDGHQVPTFEDQQGFTHRAATDVQCLGDLLLLNTLSRFELAADDPLGQVVGNLLGEAVRRLERHGFPLKSATCASAPV